MFFKKEKKLVNLEKYKSNFTTVDGVKHEGCVYKWVITNRLKCDVPRYLMLHVKEDGYIEDDKEIMYPLYNVISIEWEKISSVATTDNFNEFSVFLTNDEVEKALQLCKDNKYFSNSTYN